MCCIIIIEIKCLYTWRVVLATGAAGGKKSFFPPHLGATNRER